jgi:alpha-tubulin suppressor-like RCC1 family protein
MHRSTQISYRLPPGRSRRRCGDGRFVKPNHMLAVKSADGSVWDRGANNNGQLGIGRQPPAEAPSADDRCHRRDMAVAAGASNSMVRFDGAVRATGYHLYGQIGDGHWTTPRTSVVTVFITGVTEIAAGSYSSYGRKRWV